MFQPPEWTTIVGILTGCSFEEAKLGMGVELIAEKLYSDEQGKDYLTRKFQPV
jgi:hypothetical protein